MVQGLGLHAPDAGAQGSIPHAAAGSSHVTDIPREIWHSQINKQTNIANKTLEPSADTPHPQNPALGKDLPTFCL